MSGVHSPTNDLLSSSKGLGQSAAHSAFILGLGWLHGMAVAVLGGTAVHGTDISKMPGSPAATGLHFQQ